MIHLCSCNFFLTMSCFVDCAERQTGRNDATYIHGYCLQSRNRNIVVLLTASLVIGEECALLTELISSAE